MKKILSILLTGFLAVMVISCNYEKTLDQLGLDVRDIPLIETELIKKGLNVQDTLFVERDEYLLGLYKLNRLTEKEINRVEELKFINIRIANYFCNKGLGNNESEARLVIDYKAPINKIKHYVLKNAAFAYDEHLKEFFAYWECKELGEFLRAKGMGPVEKSIWISWRECLIGLKKLSFISKAEIEGAYLGRLTIKIGEESKYLGDNKIQISYKASLREIKKFLLIY